MPDPEKRHARDLGILRDAESALGTATDRLVDTRGDDFWGAIVGDVRLALKCLRRRLHPKPTDRDEVRAVHPLAYAKPCRTTRDGILYAIVIGPDADSDWAGTGPTEDAAWKDAKELISWAVVARRIESGGQSNA